MEVADDKKSPAGRWQALKSVILSKFSGGSLVLQLHPDTKALIQQHAVAVTQPHYSVQDVKEVSDRRRQLDVRDMPVFPVCHPLFSRRTVPWKSLSMDDTYDGCPFLEFWFVSPSQARDAAESLEKKQPAIGTRKLVVVLPEESLTAEAILDVYKHTMEHFKFPFAWRCLPLVHRFNELNPAVMRAGTVTRARAFTAIQSVLHLLWHTMLERVAMHTKDMSFVSELQSYSSPGVPAPTRADRKKLGDLLTKIADPQQSHQLTEFDLQPLVDRARLLHAEWSQQPVQRAGDGKEAKEDAEGVDPNHLKHVKDQLDELNSFNQLALVGLNRARYVLTHSVRNFPQLHRVLPGTKSSTYVGLDHISALKGVWFDQDTPAGQTPQPQRGRAGAAQQSYQAILDATAAFTGSTVRKSGELRCVLVDSVGYQFNETEGGRRGNTRNTQESAPKMKQEPRKESKEGQSPSTPRRSSRKRKRPSESSGKAQQRRWQEKKGAKKAEESEEGEEESEEEEEDDEEGRPVRKKNRLTLSEAERHGRGFKMAISQTGSAEREAAAVLANGRQAAARQAASSEGEEEAEEEDGEEQWGLEDQEAASQPPRAKKEQRSGC